MAYSSILGADRAPTQPSGRGSDLLGPSDSSDSGSDALFSDEIHGDSDGAGTGERGAVAGADAVEGADIAPDRVVRMDAAGEAAGMNEDDNIPGSGNGFPEADPDGQEFTDLDADDAGADEGTAESDR
ncbi:hypothetical protein [Ramlibacter tataouinensis]|uniref:Chemotaxis protein n=1 Tax=Ramlibacter tataouinensis (strain ATCC BAA-407 / DSM 14655 / LMG 21543 / TTB310) TaxID=365046 RepID=F5Y606_RAMTT|nr:hypothetical protein [Ramlibacter tataouinensis]AEG91510.1 Hypothetical protein Rta_04390 [Ramlibacter tataouinensis TTB310]